ncbi:Metallopeptidase family M24, putative [Angomonas deanei]|uniref:Metallopeptidase family M24, putative n=1 Tax=Angomonas deanei TaxID=59799 RepID=A0A7G2CJK0_9TRYP|nr:Metallopeptidase family M24, putative [Angomonas deanei]
MARGYVGSRSKSARPTLKLKRQRAASLTDLRLQKEEKKDTEQGEKEVAQRRKVKVVRRGASASGEEKEKKIKTRSSSLVRQRIQQEEEALEESDLELSEDEEETIGDREVLTKYQLLGKAVDQVLQLLEGLCLPGANTYDLCHRGDTEVLAAVGAMYSKQKDPKTGKRMAKGISYPTNISVNEVLCNHIPLSAEEGVVLKGNDVVKVHLGAYLDGYPVTAARTIIVPAGETAEPKQVTLTREVLSAYEAGRMALLVACRSLLPGTNTADITDRMAAVGVNYQTEAVEGVLSHRVKRWVPDGTDCFIQRRVSLEEPQQDVAETTVRPLQVWTVDVAFTNNGCVCQATPPEDRRDRRKRYHTTTVGEEAHIFRRVPAGGAPPSRVPFVLDLLQLVDEYLYCFPFHYQQFEKQYVLDHHFGKEVGEPRAAQGQQEGAPHHAAPGQAGPADADAAGSGGEVSHPSYSEDKPTPPGGGGHYRKGDERQ